MSKKKLVLKKLKKGKFYAVHEGSRRGHPGKLYWKNDNKNLYLFIKTGTTPSPDNIILVVPTEKGVKKSYVYKRPMLAKRRDIGGELYGMAFSKADRKTIKEISVKEFDDTKSITRTDRRYVKRLRKKPKIKKIPFSGAIDPPLRFEALRVPPILKQKAEQVSNSFAQGALHSSALEVL